MYQEFKGHQKGSHKLSTKDRVSQTESKIKPLVVDSYLRNMPGDQNLFISPRRTSCMQHQNTTPTNKTITERFKNLRKSAGVGDNFKASKAAEKHLSTFSVTK